MGLRHEFAPSWKLDYLLQVGQFQLLNISLVRFEFNLHPYLLDLSARDVKILRPQLT
jgi:hypothetical protein